jgi:hypothetical protein
MNLLRFSKNTIPVDRLKMPIGKSKKELIKINASKEKRRKKKAFSQRPGAGETPKGSGINDGLARRSRVYADPFGSREAAVIFASLFRLLILSEMRIVIATVL